MYAHTAHSYPFNRLPCYQKELIEHSNKQRYNLNSPSQTKSDQTSWLKLASYIAETMAKLATTMAKPMSTLGQVSFAAI